MVNQFELLILSYFLTNLYISQLHYILSPLHFQQFALALKLLTHGSSGGQISSCTSTSSPPHGQRHMYSVVSCVWIQRSALALISANQMDCVFCTMQQQWLVKCHMPSAEEKKTHRILVKNLFTCMIFSALFTLFNNWYMNGPLWNLGPTTNSGCFHLMTQFSNSSTLRQVERFIPATTTVHTKFEFLLLILNIFFYFLFDSSNE